jgi:hypothetical protein
LDRLREFYESASGFYLMGDVERGDLSPERDMAFPVSLVEGSEYLVAGFCHRECQNLDLALLDPEGEEIVVDDLPDAEPLLAFTAESTGWHRIRVTMRECALQHCPFAVGVFVGSRAGPPGSEGPMEVRLARFRAELAEAGYRGLETGRAGSMDHDVEVRFPISLQEGTEYRIVGVCDDDCEDMDLTLLDPLGREVDSDHLPDPSPLLVHEPDASGEYTVSVYMASCWVDPCAYQILPFAKGSRIGPGGTLLAAEPVFEAVHRGRLEEGDEQTREGRLFDEYTVEAQAGQTIILDLRSEAFDTFLVLRSPGGQQEENDDFGTDTGHSHLELVAPEDGVYTIRVTSFTLEPGGGYTLEIALVEG